MQPPATWKRAIIVNLAISLPMSVSFYFGLKAVGQNLESGFKALGQNVESGMRGFMCEMRNAGADQPIPVSGEGEP
jgi:hypothetical protein